MFRLNSKLGLKPEEIYPMNFIDCLNWLSFFKEYDEWEQRMIDKKNGKMRF
jgi:hypothetical protein